MLFRSLRRRVNIDNMAIFSSAMEEKHFSVDKNATLHQDDNQCTVPSPDEANSHLEIRTSVLSSDAAVSLDSDDWVQLVPHDMPAVACIDDSASTPCLDFDATNGDMPMRNQMTPQHDASMSVASKLSNAETGLKKDGTPDLRTKKGKAMAAAAQTASSVSTPAATSVRNASTSPIEASVASKLSNAETGLKKDGTPDLRTKKGKAMAAAMLRQG